METAIYLLSYHYFRENFAANQPCSAIYDLDADARAVFEWRPSRIGDTA